jgi:predicted TIM-barrel fold metal-dependent hydrolase
MGPKDIVDAQVHVLDLDRPVAKNDDRAAAERVKSGKVFTSPYAPVRPMTGEGMVRAMDEAGIAAAILVTPSFYGWDNSHSLEVAEAYPHRFRVVGLIDHNAADVADQIQCWAALPFTLGMRANIGTDAGREQLVGGAYDSYFAAAARWGVPVCLRCSSYPQEAADVIQRHPDVYFVLDHFGLAAPVPGYSTLSDVDITGELPVVLDYARFPNVSVKLTGGPSLSTQSYPFDDLWPMLASFIDRFGPERLFWGSDWTRVYNGTYAEGVGYILDSDRLAEDEKEALMGRSLRICLGWT